MCVKRFSSRPFDSSYYVLGKYFSKNYNMINCAMAISAQQSKYVDFQGFLDASLRCCIFFQSLASPSKRARFHFRLFKQFSENLLKSNS